MIKSNYYLLGVMSGTSLDGIDLTYVHFSENAEWTFKILHSETIEYPQQWKAKLGNLIHESMDNIKIIDVDYTAFLAKTIGDFINRNHISQLDAVCSHGHTALHEPDKGLTYQIGNLPLLAKLLNKTVVCDFRIDDVALGGEGAPLVPFGDATLLSNYDSCLNLGGFANISFELNDQRIAFDISPVNIVLNHLANELGLPFDEGGKVASSGNVNQKLFEKLNALAYYSKNPPKSLGAEWVSEVIFPLMEQGGVTVEEKISTFTEHVAYQIAQVLKVYKITSVLVTGGGAYNSYLIKRIQDLSETNLIIPDGDLIEFKEALIFAFLGLKKLRSEINCFASVTGAPRDHSIGRIYNP